VKARPGLRQRGIRLAVLLILLGFAVRLVQIQVVQADELAAEGLAGRTIVTEEPARRGDIVSADGIILATDALRYRVEANQQEIAKFEMRDKSGAVVAAKAAGAARLLAPVLGLKEGELHQLLDGDQKWVELARSVSPAQWDAIKLVGVRGIFAKKFYERSYPAGAVAGNLIGFPYMGDGDTDVPTHFTGVELTQDERLSGSPGKATTEVGGGGQAIPGGEGEAVEAVPGCSVRLTIDSDLQWATQEAIDAQVEAVGAESGLVVVIDTETFEVLALADSGSVNPLEAREGDPADWGSRAVQDVFEPGSTGKVVTMAEILETGEAKPETAYTVPHIATFGGQEFHDHDEHGTLQWTLNGILAYSSNVGTIMAAQNIPDQVRYDYLQKFGFGQATGVELPAEHPGILHVPGTDAWDGRTRNTVLFGQGIAVNGLQAAAVYATLGNDGETKPIHLVKGWQCPDGSSGTTAGGKSKRVVSSKTAATLIEMLESVVDDGTGKSAQIAGYRVAGKTGTSEAGIGADGEAAYFVSSFIGLAPADNPRVAVAVIVNDAKTSSWGSVVAAPVFKTVTAFALQRLDVAPSTTAATPLPTDW
jgi:cell division protein FtsI (penicillin-binding protein 3)